MQQRPPNPLMYVFRFIFIVFGFFIVRAIYRHYKNPTPKQESPKEERPKWPL